MRHPELLSILIVAQHNDYSVRLTLGAARSPGHAQASRAERSLQAVPQP